jgi:hypothetical protein
LKRSYTTAERCLVVPFDRAGRLPRVDRADALTAALNRSSVLVRDLPKSAKDMLVVEFSDLEIGSAAVRY